ncbi:MAG: TonB-dependent receptor [Paludibacter sp.]|nr:TonB-dependent receptor [Paludibacter sp.]
MKKIIIILISFIAALNISAAEIVASPTNLQGKITDKSGQPVIGASLYFPDLKTGTVTNADGFYTIDNLPKRKMLVQINSVGYKMIIDKVDLAATHQKDYVMDESITEMNEVTVTGQTVATQMSKTPSPISVVTTTQLQQQASTNIIDALSSQPGVSQITTGGGISKPVIRGLGYNRVVVVDDGVRQEGQQWGDEHGIEIDENNVNRVEILKGPASLMYGSDAMAGVINFFSAPTLPEGQMKLNALANYQTNNGLMAYSLDYAGHKKSFLWDFRYSNKQAHAYQNSIDGYVYNSGFSENAVSALLGITKDWGYSHLTLSTYHLTPGIVEGNRDSLTGKFIKPVALSNGTVGEALATNADFTSYNHQMPYQQVNHYKAVWDNNIMLGDGSLKATVGYQQNRRQEFANPLNPNQYGLYFLLQTITYDFNYQLPEFNGYNFSVGINGMYQNSQNKGTEFLVPEYQLFDVGTFIVGKKTFGNLDVSGGLRFDNRAETGNALYLNTAGVKTTANDPAATERFSPFSTNFNGISGSIGASLKLSDNWVTKLNLSHGFRAPNIDELSSNGVHDGTIRYEIGNPKLKSESSLQLDYEIGYNTEHVNAKLNLFANNISNYIFSHKLNSVNGGDSIRSGYETYKFDAGKVQMIGGEAYVDIHPHPLDWLHFENGLSYVYSQLANQPDSTRYLPFTPAPKWTSDLRAEFKATGKYFRNSFVSIGIEHDFKQDKIYSAYNTETVTNAYTLLNAGIGTDVVWNKHKLFSLYINGTNLADIAYQSHLSRLKYEPMNNVTGQMGVFNMGRNISLKLIIPVNL